MTDRDLGTTYYVVNDPHQKVARVVGGPFDIKEARTCADITVGRTAVRNALYLVHDIKHNDYRVEWADGVERPDVLVATDGGRNDGQLDRVETWDAHGNPYWNGVTRSGSYAPGTGTLHRARIEGHDVVEIECGQRAETWVPFTARSTGQRKRLTCSKCGDLTRVPGVKRDTWNRVQLTDEYAPAEWSPKPVADGGRDFDDQAAYLAAELSIPEEEARRYLENQTDYGEGEVADD
ncbi:hypothetical protein C2R22_24420 (plasmid) [Salinigranum rubrum]|uniref:Uncharacterized protein n=1 Tax=Salinigranum rubrum TaxID=755307 RepID=A0A2I8VRX8_9EURY|nr:hypothetical protein [Salinigranum rubrum]AUV84678.1 hypothetical protein C2R22_24420 [Salinigranum rubrum]